MEKELINKTYCKKEFNKHLLEQYKLYVKSAEEISSKRNSSNNFYLTLNSILFTIAGSLTFLNKEPFVLIIPLIGICVSWFWLRTIKSYRGINKAKFNIIHELEKHLPSALFKVEDTLIKKDKKHKSLTKVESWIPKIFMLLYVIIIICIIV